MSTGRRIRAGSFRARSTRTANALDPNTRTLLTQVDVPNPHDALRPGMYLQVKFIAARALVRVLAPSAALVWRPDGTVVGSAGQSQQGALPQGADRPRPRHGNGSSRGLEDGDTVVVHPGDALPEGRQVEIAAEK